MKNIIPLIILSFAAFAAAQPPSFSLLNAGPAFQSMIDVPTLAQFFDTVPSHILVAPGEGIGATAGAALYDFNGHLFQNGYGGPDLRNALNAKADVLFYTFNKACFAGNESIVAGNPNQEKEQHSVDFTSSFHVTQTADLNNPICKSRFLVADLNANTRFGIRVEMERKFVDNKYHWLKHVQVFDAATNTWVLIPNGQQIVNTSNGEVEVASFPLVVNNIEKEDFFAVFTQSETNTNGPFRWFLPTKLEIKAKASL